MQNHNYGFWDYLRDLILEGERWMACGTIFVLSAVPFTCVLILTALRLDISQTVLEGTIAFIFFGSGFIGVMGLVRSKEQEGGRRILAMFFNVLIVLVLWGMAGYLLFS